MSSLTRCFSAGKCKFSQNNGKKLIKISGKKIGKKGISIKRKYMCEQEKQTQYGASRNCRNFLLEKIVA